jgi:hypothetical protein
MILDNAPYHKGIALQFESKTKDEIAAILRLHNISSIEFDHPGADGAVVTAHVQVPVDGVKWAVGFPSKSELIQGAVNALKARNANVDRPPWERLLDRANFHWEIIWSAPYMPKHIPVELKWADGKNFVAAPEQQFEQRTVSDVIDLLRDRWYKGPTTGMSQFQHCEREMDLWVAENEENDDFLSGSVLNSTFSVPSDAVLDQWRIAAGIINADNSLIVEQDTYLTGDVNFGNEE